MSYQAALSRYSLSLGLSGLPNVLFKESGLVGPCDYQRQFVISGEPSRGTEIQSRRLSRNSIYELSYRFEVGLREVQSFSFCRNERTQLLPRRSSVREIARWQSLARAFALQSLTKSWTPLCCSRRSLTDKLDGHMSDATTSLFICMKSRTRSAHTLPPSAFCRPSSITR